MPFNERLHELRWGNLYKVFTPSLQERNQLLVNNWVVMKRVDRAANFKRLFYKLPIGVASLDSERRILKDSVEPAYNRAEITVYPLN
jgi:hypothetical protein